MAEGMKKLVDIEHASGKPHIKINLFSAILIMIESKFDTIFSIVTSNY